MMAGDELYDDDVTSGPIEDEDHDDRHPDTVEGCSECENRAERSAEMWERMMRTY